MTPATDNSNFEAIEALKRDGVEGGAPADARRRVAVRLAGAGLAGLGVTAWAASDALASTTAVGSSAAAPTSSAVATVTLGALTKTLVVGMGLGASVGLGLYVSFDRAPRSSGRDAVALLTTAPSQVRMQPAAPAPGKGPARNVSTVETGDDAADASVAPRAEQRHESTTRERVAPELHAAASVNPGPELPVAPSPANASSSLAAQQALLERARGALARGEAGAALGFLREHQTRFASTAFEEERRFLSIKALLVLGRTQEARERATAFATRFPHSVLSPSLASAFAAAGVPADFRTEKRTSAQSTKVEAKTP